MIIPDGQGNGTVLAEVYDADDSTSTGAMVPSTLTVPVTAGSYVVHYAQKIHYDGAKCEECIIQVLGMGPATSIPAEKK